jgi:hypothetical protein
MASKKPTKVPKIQRRYDKYTEWQLNRSNRKPTPKRKRIRIEVSCGSNPQKIYDLAVDISKATGVPMEKIRLENHYHRGNILAYTRDQTDDEYDKDVKEVARFNAALARYRADLAAVQKWNEDVERERRELAMNSVLPEVKRTVKEEMLNDAKLIAAIKAEALKDPAFIKQIMGEVKKAK